MRSYIPRDGDEPVDYDFYYDVPAKTAKDIPARWYIKIERDPERAANLERRQNEVILELLQWAHDYLALRDDKNTPYPRATTA